MQFKLWKIDKLNLDSLYQLKLQNTRHVTLIIQLSSLQHCKSQLTLSKTVTWPSERSLNFGKLVN